MTELEKFEFLFVDEDLDGDTLTNNDVATSGVQLESEGAFLWKRSREERKMPGHKFCWRIVSLISAVALAWPSAYAETTTSVPDFSGLWGRTSLNFAPPLVGPGPVRNLMRRPDGAQNGAQLVGDYNNPILKPLAAEILKKRGEISLSGRPFPDPWNQCRLMQLPYIWSNQVGFQMLQERDQVTLIYFDDHQVRRVRMNASHPAQVTPTWEGDSVGRYENGALVVDTIGVKAGPLAMVDRLGTPFSEALHIIERFRLIDYDAARDAVAREEMESARIPVENGEGVIIDPDYRGKAVQVQVEITVEDPVMFTTPWTAVVTYRRALGEFPELVCAEGTFQFYAPAIPTGRPDF